MNLPYGPALLTLLAVATGAALVLAVPPAGGNAAAAAYPPAPAITGIDAWINSPPLALGDLRGKVVLVDFWTYGCSNCLNHLPDVKAWHARYKDQGLVVVGVHTPEFAFEKPTSKVQAAVTQLRIPYAVAQDNSYATWKAFDNQFWPAIYLIDKTGRVVYRHYGEGNARQTEREIQALLAEPAPAPVTAPAPAPSAAASAARS